MGSGVLSKRQFLRFLISQAPLLLAVIGLSVALGVVLDRMERTQLDTQITIQTDELARDLQLAFQTRLHGVQLAVGNLVTPAEIMPAMTGTAFARVANRILENDPTILSVLIADGYVVRHVLPQPQNAAMLGYDFRQNPTEKLQIDAVITAGRAVVSPPFVSVQGLRAIAVRESINAPDGTFRGLASIALDLERVMAQLIADARMTHGYDLAIVMPQVGLFGDPALLGRNPRKIRLAVTGLPMTLHMVPAGGWAPRPIVTLPRIGLVIGTCLLLFSGYANYSRNYRRRLIMDRLEKGIDALSGGVVIFDANDRLVHWNDTYARLFSKGAVLHKGMSFAEMMQMDVKHGIYRVPAGQEDQWLNRMMNDQRVADDAAEVQLADGRWVKMLTRRTAEGDLVGVRFDITDLKRAQLAAERMSTAKSEFISVVSHELRTPLTVILGFGRLLRARPALTGDPVQDAFTRDAVDRIVQSGDHLLKLVNEMLDYVNLTGALPDQAAKPFDLDEVISRSTEEFKPVADAKGVSLEVSSTHVRVAADPVRVAQIMENLLSNAVKFTSTGGKVRVHVAPGPERVKISVSDTGDGIPKDKLDAIFEEFSQVSPSGTRRQGGTGLGLAITKRLVALQGGDITVQSAPGKGSTFTFSLPLQHRDAA
jgi:two-component system, cell cycle sensor histidine kinase PleC